MIEAVHFSRLKNMSLSAAHYLAAGERDEETPAKRMGSLIHQRTLGGVLLVYDGDRAGNAWKAFRALVASEPHFVFDGAHNGKAWIAAKAEAVGRVIVSSVDLERSRRAVAVAADCRARGVRLPAIVTREEYERACVCADVVRAHPVAGPLLAGEHEVPLEWSYLGRACAGTLDVLHPHRLVEVKTSAISEPEWFARQALRMGYPAQCSWYREGARENGYGFDDCFIIAAETRPPFAVSCLKLTERALEQGEKTLRLWMERLLACEATGVWPEYVQSVVDLDVPDDDVELVFDDEEAA